MGLFDSLFRSKEVLGIAEETLEFTIQASEQTHPNEYMGMLRGTEATRLDLDRDGLVITDVLVIPGTESNSVSATVKTNQVPNDRHAVGSVHSHPNGVVRPSTADLQTFGRGEVHIIIGAPYRRTDWRAFDNQGEPTDLEVIDVELPDPEEFFYFDQADIDADIESERRRWSGDDTNDIGDGGNQGSLGGDTDDDRSSGDSSDDRSFGDDWPGSDDEGGQR